MMINIRIKKNLIKVMSVVTLLSSLIFATEISAKTEAYGAFFVEPQLPENQYGKNLGYFDLLMEPDTKQTITFDVINQGDEEMTAKIAFNNGSTSVNGEKSYDENIEPDESMKVPTTKMAKLNKT